MFSWAFLIDAVTPIVLWHKGRIRRSSCQFSAENVAWPWLAVAAFHRTVLDDLKTRQGDPVAHTLDLRWHNRMSAAPVHRMSDQTGAAQLSANGGSSTGWKVLQRVRASNPWDIASKRYTLEWSRQACTLPSLRLPTDSAKERT